MGSIGWCTVCWSKIPLPLYWAWKTTDGSWVAHDKAHDRHMIMAHDRMWIQNKHHDELVVEAHIISAYSPAPFLDPTDFLWLPFEIHLTSFTNPGLNNHKKLVSGAWRGEENWRWCLTFPKLCQWYSGLQAACTVSEFYISEIIHNYEMLYRTIT